MKRKSISKYSRKLQDAIIKEEPGAKAILFESSGGNMDTNQKFDLILNKLTTIEDRLDVIEKDIKDMKNTPTMKREIEMIKK